MRRFILLTFAFWFATSMTLAQVAVSVAQTTPPYSSAAPDESSAYSDASADSHFDSAGYTADSSESRALTDYLKQRKLPLVGAQVLRSSDGRRRVVLYGFVGSDFGRSDAAQKARSYMHDSSIQVDNRINVRPELLASNRPLNAPANPYSAYPPVAGSTPTEGGSSSPGASAYPGPESYKAQQASPYTQQLTSIMPLIALLGVLGMGVAGGNSGFSFGSSPFGGSSFGSPYSSPYGSPYASPYGGSPFGASPYGRPPYGNSPYGSPPYP